MPVCSQVGKTSVKYSSVRTARSKHLRMQTWETPLPVGLAAVWVLNVWWYGYIFNIYGADHGGKWVRHDCNLKGGTWIQGTLKNTHVYFYAENRACICRTDYYLWLMSLFITVVQLFETDHFFPLFTGFLFKQHSKTQSKFISAVGFICISSCATVMMKIHKKGNIFCFPHTWAKQF